MAFSTLCIAYLTSLSNPEELCFIQPVRGAACCEVALLGFFEELQERCMDTTHFSLFEIFIM